MINSEFSIEREAIDYCRAAVRLLANKSITRPFGARAPRISTERVNRRSTSAPHDWVTAEAHLVNRPNNAARKP